MEEFPGLLYQATNKLSFAQCQPDQINETNLLYRKEKYDDCSRPFELEVAWQPDGIIIKRLFVKPQLQRNGVGGDIINSLKQVCRTHGYGSIMLHDVLPEAVGYWKRREFCVFGNSGVWWNINLRRLRL